MGIIIIIWWNHLHYDYHPVLVANTVLPVWESLGVGHASKSSRASSIKLRGANVSMLYACLSGNVAHALNCNFFN